LISHRLSPVHACDAHLPMHQPHGALFCRSRLAFRVLPSIGITCAPKRSTNVPTQRWKHCSKAFGSMRSNTRRNVSAQGMPLGKAKTPPTRLACLSHRSQCLHPCAPAMTAKMLIIKMSVSRWARVLHSWVFDIVKVTLKVLG